MFKTIRTIVFLLAWIPLAAFAADSPVSEADLAAYKELAQTRLDAAKDSLQKDKENIEARLEAQDKRIGDMNFTLTVLGILITVLMVALGAASWFSAVARARDEARKWFEEKAKALEAEIEELRRRVREGHDHVDKLREDAAQHIESVKDDVHEKAEAVMAAMEKEIGAASGKPATATAPSVEGKDGDALKQLEQLIRSKPETEYGFDDWNGRAFNAWRKNDFEGAARYWKEAAQAKDATDAKIAQSLFYAGIVLGEMNRNEEAIAVYDEVDRRYGAAPEAALRELVAKSLVNKGGALGQMNRSEDAIAVYDEVDRRFGAAPEAALRELVAKALVNKGVVFGQMDRSEDAVAVYDEVDRRFGAAPEAALREQVANALGNKGYRLGQMNRNEEKIVVYDDVVKRYGDAPEAALRERVSRALNGKGFALLCRAKECWAEEATRQADLQAAAELFERAVNDVADKSIVWGNQAYAAFLLGQPETARPLLRQALQQGGEELYKAELDDLDIHPVPPDAEFRIMLEESWAEVKPQSLE